MSNSTTVVLEEVAGERQRQDKRWGGPSNDDGHGRFGWTGLIAKRLDTIYRSSSYSQFAPSDRRQLLEIAALAVAAIESHDRLTASLAAGETKIGEPEQPSEAEQTQDALADLLYRARTLLKVWEEGLRGVALTDELNHLSRTVERISQGLPFAELPIPAPIGAAQERIGEWARKTFPRHTPFTITAHLQEEALELMQVLLNGTPDDGDRPVGREIGGIGVLLLTLCDHLEISFAECLLQEHQRNLESEWVTDERGMTHRKKGDREVIHRPGDGMVDNASESVECCRVCGCTDDNCNGCVERTGEPCHWVEPGLCSACVGTEGEATHAG